MLSTGIFRDSKLAVAHFGRVRSSPVLSADKTWLRFPIPDAERAGASLREHIIKKPHWRFFNYVLSTGIGPVSPASEAGVLSIRLRERG